MDKKLESWQRDEVAREAWRQFLNSPEAERGIHILEAHGVPIIVMGESTAQGAKRQAFQAGFHTALFLLQKLPDIHFKKVQEQLPEWEHIEPPNLFSEETQLEENE